MVIGSSSLIGNQSKYLVSPYQIGLLAMYANERNTKLINWFMYQCTNAGISELIKVVCSDFSSKDNFKIDTFPKCNLWKMYQLEDRKHCSNHLDKTIQGAWFVSLQFKETFKGNKNTEVAICHQKAKSPQTRRVCGVGYRTLIHQMCQKNM